MGRAGFEPATVCLRGNCSTSWANVPKVIQKSKGKCGRGRNRGLWRGAEPITNSYHQEIFFPDLISRNALVSSPHPDERIARDRQSSMAVGRWCIDTCQHCVRSAAFPDYRYCQYTGYHGLYFLAHKRRTYFRSFCAMFDGGIPRRRRVRLWRRTPDHLLKRQLL